MLEDIVEDVRIYPCGIRHTLMVNIYTYRVLQLGTEVNMLAYRVLTARCAGYLEWYTRFTCQPSSSRNTVERTQK